MFSMHRADAPRPLKTRSRQSNAQVLRRRCIGCVRPLEPCRVQAPSSPKNQRRLGNAWRRTPNCVVARSRIKAVASSTESVR